MKKILYLLLIVVMAFGMVTKAAAEREEVYIYTDSTSPLFRVDDFTSNAKVHTDLGAVISTMLFADRTYFVIMHNFPSGVDQAIVTQYDFEDLRFLVHFGLSSNATITFTDYGDRLHVYGYDTYGRVIYLGRANEQLPITDAYFFSAKDPDSFVIDD